ncbi:hypothetical protein [Lentzea albida]|uniref:Uncharacterized protein n=1 Tax=Lentzea albida TaxID=65499 RepID=A0A1H9DVP0_9PSEU|nr:hypothetical protein [Lentzea albida]SEQ16933.1 hypothetical protein SAMN04488000_10247 [Lentzea albida]
MAQAFGTSAGRGGHSACGSPPGAHHPATHGSRTAYDSPPGGHHPATLGSRATYDSPPAAHHPAARLPAVPLSTTEEVACAA